MEEVNDKPGSSDAPTRLKRRRGKRPDAKEKDTAAYKEVKSFHKTTVNDFKRDNVILKPVKKEKKKPKVSQRFQDQQRPNFFIAVQVTDEKVKEKMKTVQDAAQDMEKTLKETCVPIRKSHVTLAVFKADEQRSDDIIRAIQEVTQHYEEFNLTFEGIGLFKNQVVYAKVHPTEVERHLLPLHDAIMQKLEDLDLISTKTKEEKFDPHLTLLKTSKAKCKSARKWKFKIEDFVHHQQLKFGSSPINSVQLLSMVRPQTKEGYYYKFGECGLKSPPEPKPISMKIESTSDAPYVAIPSYLWITGAALACVTILNLGKIWSK